MSFSIIYSFVTICQIIQEIKLISFPDPGLPVNFRDPYIMIPLTFHLKFTVTLNRPKDSAAAKLEQNLRGHGEQLKKWVTFDGNTQLEFCLNKV